MYVCMYLIIYLFKFVLFYSRHTVLPLSSPLFFYVSEDINELLDIWQFFLSMLN